jgi:hypothetical protein
MMLLLFISLQDILHIAGRSIWQETFTTLLEQCAKQVWITLKSFVVTCQISHYILLILIFPLESLIGVPGAYGMHE